MTNVEKMRQILVELGMYDFLLANREELLTLLLVGTMIAMFTVYLAYRVILEVMAEQDG